MDDWPARFQRIVDLVSINPGQARALALSLDEPERTVALALIAMAAGEGTEAVRLETFLDEVTPEYTKLRNKVCELARTDTRAALDLARTIPEPWFRGQALAHVARFSDSANISALAKEATEAFDTSEDKYDAVAGAAWPIRALIERGLLEEARRMLHDALNKAAQIEKNVCRADALFSLWESVSIVDEFSEMLIGALWDACINAKSWRGPMLLRRVIRTCSPEFRDRVRAYVQTLPDCQEKTQLARAYEEEHIPQSRFFF